MAIRFRCPDCDKALKAPDHAAGHSVKCPACRKTVVIPDTYPVLITTPPQTPPDYASTYTPNPRNYGNLNPMLLAGVAAATFAVRLLLATVVGFPDDSKNLDPGDLVRAVAGIALLLVILALGVTVYALPWIIAATRRHPNTAAIAALNLLLGWALLGWVAALVWALTEVQSRDHHHYHDHQNSQP
jgi:hypothetical protein